MKIKIFPSQTTWEGFNDYVGRVTRQGSHAGNRPSPCIAYLSSVMLLVEFALFFIEASHWSSDRMISFRPLIGPPSTPPPLDPPFHSFLVMPHVYLIGIGASILIIQESWCLLYAGFVSFTCFNFILLS